MKLISSIGSLLAMAALLSSCQTKDPYAQQQGGNYSSPYYGPQPTTNYPQNGDYVDVSPVQPQQDYSGGGYQQGPQPYQPQQPAYQPPSYNSQPSYQPSPYQPPMDTTPVSGARSHTVARGDTLYNISKRYGTTVGAIQQANGLNGSTLIYPGDVLDIP